MSFNSWTSIHFSFFVGFRFFSLYFVFLLYRFRRFFPLEFEEIFLAHKKCGTLCVLLLCIPEQTGNFLHQFRLFFISFTDRCSCIASETQDTRKCLFKSPVDGMQECATWICYTTCKYLDQRKLKRNW
jgi:hypothetical protein